MENPTLPCYHKIQTPLQSWMHTTHTGGYIKTERFSKQIRAQNIRHSCDLHWQIIHERTDVYHDSRAARLSFWNLWWNLAETKM
jgi:hypothetical protein